MQPESADARHLVTAYEVQADGNNMLSRAASKVLSV